MTNTVDYPYIFAQVRLLFFISRDINFILTSLPELEINKRAVMEALIFSYCLGEKTFYKDIYRTLTSHLFYKQKESEPKIAILFKPEFGGEYLEINNKEYWLESIKDLFLESCKRRVKTYIPQV